VVTEYARVALLVAAAGILPTAAGFILGLATIYEPVLAVGLGVLLAGTIFTAGVHEYRSSTLGNEQSQQSPVHVLAGMLFVLSGLLGYGTALAYAADFGLQLDAITIGVATSALACMVVSRKQVVRGGA